MKNIFKASAVLLMGLSIIVSSCKKDEQIIEGCTDITATNYQSLATSNDGSCIYAPAVEGCTDSSAMNYQSLATNDDGTCIFAYDIAQGQWNIETACQELTISIPLVGDFPVPLNDMFPDTVEITGEGEGVVAMDINGNIVLADVANDGKVTIQDDQKITFDSGIPLVGVVDVNITGSGMIESASNGDLALNLAFEIPLAGTQTSSCEITFTK